MNNKIDILSLEKDDKIWSFRGRLGLPLYLIVRFRLLQAMIDNSFSLSNPHVKGQFTIIGMFKYLYYAVRYNIFFVKKSDVLIFGTGAVNNKTKDGIYYNRLYDDFVDNDETTVSIIETSNKFGFSFPNKRNVFNRDLIDIFVYFLSIIIPKAKSNKKLSKEFSDYVSSVCPEAENYLYKAVLRGQVKFSCGYFFYKLFFKIKKPKMVVLENGHYGNLAYIIKAARDLGIEVSEYQHGYIGFNHPAYNYAIENLPDDNITFMPSYFLTHGEYWSKSCRIPGKKIVIGYPDLANHLKTFHLKRVDSNQDVLVISGGTVPNKIIDFVMEFIKLNSERQVFLRPHPSERPEMYHRYQCLLDIGVQLDTDDLYTSLASIGVLVSFEVSTVLYESVNFTKQIYLANDNYANFYESHSPFIRFSGAEDFNRKLKLQHEVQVDPQQIWAQNAQQRFSSFLNSVLKG